MPDQKISQDPESLIIKDTDLFPLVDPTEVDVSLRNRHIKGSNMPKGIVVEIIEGANISVDNADPANPIISSATTTSAGVTTSVNFTADETTVVAGTFYIADDETKGLIPSVQQDVVNADNQKQFFAQDLITLPFLTDSPFPSGDYTSILNIEVDNDANDARFTAEAYLTDVDGNAINSGVTGAPVGDLGVTVLSILDSGITHLVTGGIRNVFLIGNLVENIVILTDQRLLIHVSAQKVGTIGGNVTMSCFYGSDHTARLVVPVVSTTSSIINVSNEPGATATDALNSLKTKTDHLNVNSDASFLAVMADVAQQELRISVDTVLTSVAVSLESSGAKRITGGSLILADSPTFTYASGDSVLDIDCLDLGADPQTITLVGMTLRVKRIKGVGVLTIDGTGLTYEIAETLPIAGTGTVTKAFWSNTNESTAAAQNLQEVLDTGSVAVLTNPVSISAAGVNLIDYLITAGAIFKISLDSGGELHLDLNNSDGLKIFNDSGTGIQLFSGTYTQAKSTSTITNTWVQVGDLDAFDFRSVTTKQHTIENIDTKTDNTQLRNKFANAITQKSDGKINEFLQSIANSSDSFVFRDEIFEMGPRAAADYGPNNVNNPLWLTDKNYTDRGDAEIVIAVKYTQTIAKGEAVYVVGWDVAQSVVTVGLADNTVGFAKPALGLAAEDGIVNDYKNIKKLGIIEGLDTSLWGVNVKLYLSTNGTIDVLENIVGSKQVVGTVVTSAFGTGIIMASTDITELPSEVKDKIASFALDAVSNFNTYTYYNNVSDGVATINTGALSVGGETKVLKMGTNKIDIVAGAGVTLSDPDGVALAGLASVGIERLTDASYGLADEVYRLF